MFKRVRFLQNPDAPDNPRAPWQVAIELNRLLAVMLIFALGAILFLVVWHQLNPVTVKEAVYVEFQSGANNFVLVGRAGKNISRNEALISMEARRYVTAREPINGMDEADRYATVRATSCEKVWNDFKGKYGGKEGVLSRKEFRREIRIKRDSRLTDGAHLVEFEVRDWLDGITDKDKAPWQLWTATMAYSFEPTKVRFDDVAVNGTGIQICEYNLSRGSK